MTLRTSGKRAAVAVFGTAWLPLMYKMSKIRGLQAGAARGGRNPKNFRSSKIDQSIGEKRRRKQAARSLA
jgi:hypothetical protein